MRATRFAAQLILLAVLFAGMVQVAQAQDAEPVPTPEPAEGVTDDQVNAVARQLYCPVCDNVPLDVCGTRACADWRDEIRRMLAEGRSEAEIRQYFAERYGRRVLATPEASGIDLVVWILPPAGVLIGAVVLILALRKMAPGALAAQAGPQVAPTYDDLDPEYVARLERELKEFSE